jgi:hypothetical protein
MPALAPASTYFGVDARAFAKMLDVRPGFFSVTALLRS